MTCVLKKCLLHDLLMIALYILPTPIGLWSAAEKNDIQFSHYGI